MIGLYNVYVTQHTVIITIGLFSGTISISSQMTQCRIILVLQPITKLYLFTIELKLRDDGAATQKCASARLEQCH